ncbi:MAG TPA: ATP-binding cassette domain-containing protein [Nitrososphaerales archaeon]|nr:ATP-binding cassette domain-containing protein [Nitrososphaerales archaeon]
MDSPAPVVSLSNVSLVLDGKRVLSHVDWDVLPGENWVVIGPNGAGKTSLLSIINGYRWPSSGSVSVLGRRFGDSDLRELRTETGLASSYLDSMIDGDEKVLDLVVSGKFGSVRVWGKVKAADVARATSLLKAIGCGMQLGKTLSKLSQGERQKVAIARAMMARPRLLVLDEPCEGLDIAARESFLDGLAPLLSRRGGPSFIEVTHRTEDIPPGFTHALLLRGGRVVGSGEIGATLTSEKLSRCLGTEVELRSWGGRFYMMAAKKR